MRSYVTCGSVLPVVRNAEPDVLSRSACAWRGKAHRTGSSQPYAESEGLTPSQPVSEVYQRRSQQDTPHGCVAAPPRSFG